MVHHGGSLRRLSNDPELVEQLGQDYRKAPIDDRDRAMLRYVEKLTLDPGSIAGDDVRFLKDSGFGDHEILDICQVAAYFAFVNRLASGLGVELEV